MSYILSSLFFAKGLSDWVNTVLIFYDNNQSFPIISMIKNNLREISTKSRFFKSGEL